MISVSETEKIHQILIKEFGGASGIRDTGALESALSRPFQTFGGQDLYSSTVEKAAALMESILVNHPFVDGNKRTGYVLMRIMLMQSGLDINATEEQKYDFVIAVASGKCNYEQIQAWLELHAIPLKGG